MQKNSRKVGLLLAFVSMFTTAFFVATAFAQFVGPGSTPPAGGGTLQVDTNYNVGLGTSSALITPTGGVSFGRLFTISSSSNPGFSLLTGTNRYAWYADTASGTLSLAGSTNGSGGSRIFQITPGGTVYGYDYHSINNTNYYVDPGMSLMPYSANFAGNVLLNGSRTLQIGTTGCQYLSFANASNTVAYCNNQFNFNTTQSQGFTFTGGNVGIGTASPGAQVDIVSNSGSNIPLRAMYASGINSGTMLDLGANGTHGLLTFTYNPTTITSNQYGPLEIITQGNQNIALLPNGTGKVGIGTTAPNGRFEVDNSTGNLYGDLVVRTDNAGGVGGKLSVVNFGGGTGDAAVIAFGTDNSTLFDSSGNNQSNAEIRAVNVNGSTNATDLRFSNWSGAAENVNLVIAAGGAIGIGTTTPTTAGLVLQTNVSGVGLDMTGNRIANLGAPVNPNDAATKNYVDSSYAPGGSSGNVGGTGTSGYVPRWTGTSTIANSEIYDTGSAVGIGTTSPSQRLDVNGNINLSGGNFYSPTTLNLYPQSGTVALQVQSNLVQVSSGHNLIVASGNVGVGTSSPTTAGLVVSTNVSTVGIDVQNNRIINVGTPINAADAATKSYVDSAITTGVSGGVNGTTNYIAKFTGTNTVGNSLIYDNGTNVGIGTASPGAKLDVQGGSINTSGSLTAATINVANAGSGGPFGNGSLINFTGGSVNTAIQENWGININGEATRPVKVTNASLLVGYTSSGANFGTGNLYVSGKVGIGTTAPGTNLDVAGNINASIYYDRDNTNYYVDPAANTMPYSIVTAGSVGIGTNAPANTLQVNGDTRLGLILSSNGTFPGYGNFLYFSGGPGSGDNSDPLWFARYDTAADASQLRLNLGDDTNDFFAVGRWGGCCSLPDVTSLAVVSNGYVGINNVTSPAYPLSVGGSIYSIEYDNGTATGATTIDWSKSNTQTLVLGASPIALTFTNGQPGGHYTLALKQDATGSRLVTWPANVRWSSGVAPTLTTAANKTDYVEFVYDGLSSTFDGVGFNANF